MRSVTSPPAVVRRPAGKPHRGDDGRRQVQDRRRAERRRGDAVDKQVQGLERHGRRQGWHLARHPALGSAHLAVRQRREARAVLERFEGKRFNSPNDLVFAPVRDLTMPYGIGFPPDGRTLHVNNSRAQDGALALRRCRGRERLERSRARHLSRRRCGCARWAQGRCRRQHLGVRPRRVPHHRARRQGARPDQAAGKLANMAFADEGKTALFTGSTSIFRMKRAGKGQMPRAERQRAAGVHDHRHRARSERQARLHALARGPYRCDDASRQRRRAPLTRGRNPFRRRAWPGFPVPGCAPRRSRPHHGLP